MQLTKTKWFLPLTSLGLGVLMLTAAAIGGDARQGLEMLAVMAAVGLGILVGGRSETIRGLRGDGRDERFRTIDIHATALAGMAVITAVIGGFIVELARGHDGRPYAWIGAIGGVTYIVAVAVLRARS
jgi:hypothetical protein